MAKRHAEFLVVLHHRNAFSLVAMRERGELATAGVGPYAEVWRREDPDERLRRKRITARRRAARRKCSKP